MKKAMLVLAAALVVGCASPISQPAALGWLEAHTEAPDLNVAGEWESTASYWAGGWGYVSFTQSGAAVTGTMGPYTAEGRVAGKKLYLLIMNGRKVSYTAILEMTEPNRLGGMAVGKAFVDSPEARSAEHAPVILVRKS